MPLLIALSASVLAQEERQVGVLVEAVAPHGAALRVGLREGDLIQKWERAGASGAIESPFDLTEVETDQAPLGTVMLVGQRDGQEQHWNMGPDEWGLRSRPLFSAALQKLYEEARKRESAGAHVEAAHRWLAAGLADETRLTPWMAQWFLLHAAQSLALAHQKKQSDEIYRKALAEAQSSKPAIRVHLLRSWAGACQQENDWLCAEDHYKQALDEERKSRSETLSIAASLQGLGNALMQRDNFSGAEEYYKQALFIRQKWAPESLPVASCLSDIASLYLKRGDLGAAEEHARRALAIREKLSPDSLDVATSLNNLASTLVLRGDFAEAQEYLMRALTIRKKLTPASLDEAATLNNLGLDFMQRGDLVKADAYISRALSIEEKLIPDSRSVAQCLDNLGIIYSLRGDLSRAEEYGERALTILKKTAPGSLDVAYSLGNVSEVITQRGELIKAERYHREALDIIKRLAPGSLDEMEALTYSGELAKTRGHLVEATQYYHRALAIGTKLAPQSRHVADTLSNLAEVFLDSGDLTEAERYYTRALNIIEKLSPGSSLDAEILVGLAKVDRRRQKLNTAADLFERALNAIERQISLIGGTTSERARFRAEHVSYYKSDMEVLLAQNRPDAAFQVLERSRARSFLELLAERDLGFGADLPAEIQQARGENAAAYDRTQEQIAELSLPKDAAQIEQLQKQLRHLEAERESIGERARQASPHFAALHYPKPLGLEAVRTALDPGTALLSYSVSDDQTVLFVVLPVGQEPGLSVFDLKVTGKALRGQVDAFRKLIQREGNGSARESRQASLAAQEREFYDLLLAPVESIISSSERLLLIPDGPLQVLPFAALKDRSGHYLVEGKPLHTTMSATVYAELKRTRPAKSDKPLELAAFGDPLYPPNVQAAITANEAGTFDGELRSAVERGFALSQLPFSRVEVQSIAGLFAGHDVKYLREQATEEHAKALGKGVRYIHFATHGLLDERFPLNSSLVLTIPSKPTEGQENGFLQAWEIFEQVRLDADLVTLSACSTGLGQELNGEGLIGLTRAFQYAGARSVLASLWSVDDYRTMQLMRRFYAELHAGASKDAALQRAQLQLLHSTAEDPYYWAAFSLTGDWH